MKVLIKLKMKIKIKANWGKITRILILFYRLTGIEACGESQKIK